METAPLAGNPRETSLWPRLRSLVRRRARWLRWRMAGDRPTAAEAAFAWLFGPQTADWVPAVLGDACGLPETTAFAVAVARDYGMDRQAGRWQAWLNSAGRQPPKSAPTGDKAAALAQQAIQWYQEGRREAADQAMAQLARRQTREGAFPKSWGPLGPSRQQSGLAVVHYLAAAVLQVQAAFEGPSGDLPEEIQPDDGRTQAVLQWAALLPADARLADVGCGKGRFLRHLGKACPGMRLVGIDPSGPMLARLPPGVEARKGSLLRIPGADGEFDAALAVESLEHSLVPARAIEELCRVVRPGGRILIIDKNRGKQALSEHEPWERWFRPEELAGWLNLRCDEVRVEPISHLEVRPGGGLFLAARGRVRPEGG